MEEVLAVKLYNDTGCDVNPLIFTSHFTLNCLVEIYKLFALGFIIYSVRLIKNIGFII